MLILVVVYFFRREIDEDYFMEDLDAGQNVERNNDDYSEILIPKLDISRNAMNMQNLGLARDASSSGRVCPPCQCSENFIDIPATLENCLIPGPKMSRKIEPVKNCEPNGELFKSFMSGNGSVVIAFRLTNAKVNSISSRNLSKIHQPSLRCFLHIKFTEDLEMIFIS